MSNNPPPRLEVLSRDYIPERFLHREIEIAEIEKYVFDAPNFGIPPMPMLIYGDPGAGKTAIIKSLIKQHSSNPKLNIIYVNAGEAGSCDNTTAGLLTQFSATPRKNDPNPVVQFIHSLPLDRYNIIILDEIDKMLSRGGMVKSGVEYTYRNSLYLYPFIRPGEGEWDPNVKIPKLAVILIANDLTLTDKIGAALMSSFGRRWTKFYSYDLNQVVDILDDRTKIANTKHMAEDGILKETARLANNDMRDALQILFESTRTALMAGKTKLTKDDIREAATEADTTAIKKEFERMSDDEIMTMGSIYHLTVAKKIKGYSSDVYDYYLTLVKKNGLTPLSQRHFRRLCQKNEITGIISLATMAIKGSPVCYSLTLNTNIVKEALHIEIKKRATLKFTLDSGKFPEAA